MDFYTQINNKIERDIIKNFNLAFKNMEKNVLQYCQLLVQKWVRKFQMESGKAYAKVG